MIQLIMNDNTINSDPNNNHTDNAEGQERADHRGLPGR